MLFVLQQNTPRKKTGRTRAGTMETPTPPYVPSEYEKFVADKRQKNIEYMASLGLSKGMSEAMKQSLQDAKDDAEEKYDIEKFLEHRKAVKSKGGWELRVRWKGYKEEHDTWQALKQLRCDVPEMVREYVSRHQEDFKPKRVEKRKQRNLTSKKTNNTQPHQRDDVTPEGATEADKGTASEAEGNENVVTCGNHQAEASNALVGATEKDESSNEDKNANTKDAQIISTPSVSTITCNHDNYSEGVAYKSESNPKYCKSGTAYYLADTNCAICGVKFTDCHKTEFGH